MLDVLLDVIVPVVAVAAVGGIVGRRVGLDLQTMSRCVFFLFSPALVFVGLADLDIGSVATGRLAICSLAVFAGNALLALVWSGVRGRGPAAKASIAMASAIPNQGNMGLPIAGLAFGAKGLSIATLLFVIGVVLNTSAGITLGRATVSGRPSPRALLAPLRYPAAYAAAAGVIVNVTDVSVPTAIHEPLVTLAAAAIPCMLVVLGLSFHLPGRDGLSDPIAVSVNRLILGPVIALGLTTVLGLHGLTRDVTILMAGMPAAVNTTILAVELKADVTLAVRSVVVSTALSILTLTALLVILGTQR